jgi:hypothetical protein
LLSASCHHAVELEIVACIDFLMRDVWRHVYEVPGLGLGEELEPVSPAQSRDGVGSSNLTNLDRKPEHDEAVVHSLCNSNVA